MIILSDAELQSLYTTLSLVTWHQATIRDMSRLVSRVLQRLCADREVVVEDVAPLVLDVEEEDEDECHVHGHDGDHHQHPAVHRHHPPPLPQSCTVLNGDKIWINPSETCGG